MDNITRLNLLYDYYGEFLTPKQKDIFELYHLNDLSLGEIAENEGITRQGVYDIIRRSQDSLNKFEQKLGMVKRHFRFKREIKKILQSLKEMEPGVSDEYKKNLSGIYNSVAALLIEGGG